MAAILSERQNPIERWVEQMSPLQRLHAELYTKWARLSHALPIPVRNGNQHDAYQLILDAEAEVGKLLTERLGPYPPLPKTWKPFSMS